MVTKDNSVAQALYGNEVVPRWSEQELKTFMAQIFSEQPSTSGTPAIVDRVRGGLEALKRIGNALKPENFSAIFSLAATQAIEEEMLKSGKPIDTELAGTIRQAKESALGVLIQNGVFTAERKTVSQGDERFAPVKNPDSFWSRFSLHGSPREMLNRIISRK